MKEQLRHADQEEPFIPASANLPELTVKVIVLSVILTILLTAANAYLGLKAGMTISASIPAAVISMGILRFFKDYNILENNIVQTAASAGEALTAGIIFTLPALIVMGYWTHFAYWPTTIIAVLGGILGVLFSVPLRRVLLKDPHLKFPEGTAIGNVLKASVSNKSSVSYLIWGGVFGALIAFGQTGFKLVANSLQFWFTAGGTLIGAGVGFNPAMIGAGFIIGANTGVVILAGIVVGWIIGVPVIGLLYGLPLAGAPMDVAMKIWSDYIRYIGVGVMMVGGFWAVCVMLKPMYIGIRASVVSLKTAKMQSAPLRTEHDIPINQVFFGALLLAAPIFALVVLFFNHEVLPFSAVFKYSFSVFIVIFILILGFIIAAICAYFAGLVGSSANPLSSLSLIALLITSCVMVLILGDKIQVITLNKEAIGVAALVIFITTLIAAIAAISNDTIQDLKAGQMVGATPWKQQLMLMLGVIVGALVMPPILQLLFNAYGLGGVMPHPNMDASQMLAAPQAGLMAAVVEGVFTGNVNWPMILIGGVIAIICLFADFFGRNKNIRVPVLAVGLGIYLPLDTSTPLVIGGILSYFVMRAVAQKSYVMPREQQIKIQVGAHQTGLLLACGLVAGAALIGVILAIPFAISGNADALRLMPKEWHMLAGMIGLLTTLMLCMGLYRKTLKVISKLG